MGHFNEALDLFCDVNKKALLRCGIQDFSNHADTHQRLHQIFAEQGEPQKWRAPYSDGPVRRHLVALGRLPPTPPASRDTMMEEMRKLLGEVHKGGELPASYVGCTIRCAQYVAKLNPGSRSSAFAPDVTEQVAQLDRAFAATGRCREKRHVAASLRPL